MTTTGEVKQSRAAIEADMLDGVRRVTMRPANHCWAKVSGYSGPGYMPSSSLEGGVLVLQSGKAGLHTPILLGEPR